MIRSNVSRYGNKGLLLLRPAFSGRLPRFKARGQRDLAEATAARK
jgi:hypothetical protein